jgi:hypothetical protein
VGAAVYAPVLRADDSCNDVESVRAAVVARPAVPWASGVFHLDPDVVLMDFGAKGELAAAAGGAVQHRIGDELRRDQERIVGARTAPERFGERSPGVPDLDGLGGEGAGVAARARCRGCRGHYPSRGPVFVFPSLPAEGYVGNGIGPDAH